MENVEVEKVIEEQKPPRFGFCRECAACGIRIKEANNGLNTGDNCDGPPVPVCDVCYSWVGEETWTAIKIRIRSGAYYIPELGKGVVPK